MRRLLLGLMLLPAPLAHATEVAASAPAMSGEDSPFVPRASLTWPELEEALGGGDPELARGELDVALARADQRRSRLYENPSLDLGSSVAVGPLNPAGISRWQDTPQSTAGLSYRFLLGKRGPRRERADAAVSAAGQAFEDLRRGRVLALGQVLGQLALETLRAEALERLRRESAETLKLTEARLSSGFATPLDVDRMQVEATRLDQQRIASTAEREMARADCAGLVGRPCASFASADDARHFLRGWATQPVPGPEAVATRPDLQALESEARAAEAALRLADALRVPDPTLRLGYMRDQQTLAGDQPHMLGLTLSLPLTVFDRGQADLAEAHARKQTAETQRTRLLRAGRARVVSLAAAREAHLARQELLEKEAIPRAETVVQSLTRAASARLISLTDVIQARRALNELVMDEAESLGAAFTTYLALLREVGPIVPSDARPSSSASGGPRP